LDSYFIREHNLRLVWEFTSLFNKESGLAMLSQAAVCVSAELNSHKWARQDATQTKMLIFIFSSLWWTKSCPVWNTMPCLCT